MADALIVDVVRTPRGKGRADGALHDVHPQELFAQCLRALAARVGFDPDEVDDVIAGNGILTGDHDAVGRLATLLAGWPETVPGLTLNRFCGSAQQAITVAAMGVASGYQDLVVAGGVESMSRWDLTAGSVTIDGGNPDFRAAFPTVPQGISADLIATLEGFDRADVDAFAVESQRRAEVALTEGRFDRGVVAVTDAEGDVLLARDEHPRARHVARGPGEAARRVRRDGRHLRRGGAASATRRSTTSTTSTTPATRPVSSTARPRRSSRRTPGSTPTGSRRGRASAPPPPSARSR